MLNFVLGFITGIIITVAIVVFTLYRLVTTYERIGNEIKGNLTKQN